MPAPEQSTSGPDHDGPSAAGPAAPTSLTYADVQTKSTAERLGPFVLGACALILVGFILGRVTGGDVEESPTTTAVPTLEFPMGDQSRASYWGFGGVTETVSDSFDRADTSPGLGLTDTAVRWEIVSGTWRIEDNRAAAAASDTASYAVVPAGTPNPLTEATLMVVEPGAGIVFRFRDADNHYDLVVQPDEGVWELVEVLRGRREVVAEIAGPVTDGTTVTVAQRGPSLQIFLDGRNALIYDDSDLVGAGRSGLVAPAGGTGEARWDRLLIGDVPV